MAMEKCSLKETEAGDAELPDASGPTLFFFFFFLIFPGGGGGGHVATKCRQRCRCSVVPLITPCRAGGTGSVSPTDLFWMGTVAVLQGRESAMARTVVSETFEPRCRHSIYDSERSESATCRTVSTISRLSDYA